MILAHGALPISGDGGYVGSPLYDVLPAHVPGVVMLGLLPILAVVVRRSQRPTAQRLAAAYHRLSAPRRLAVWLTTSSALLHLGLPFGHELSWWTLAYLVGAVALAAGALRLVLRGRATWAAVALAGSIAGIVVSASAGSTPDQVAMVTKMGELTALVALTAQARTTRRVVALVAVTALASLVSMSAWTAALAVNGGHHTGNVPPLGVLVPSTATEPPVGESLVVATALRDATAVAIAAYADPTVAALAGYDVEGMTGLDFHADNPTFLDDGIVLDPTRPETLVYAVGDDGPLLLGAMFQMPEVHQPGPPVGGRNTVWHAHEQVCLGLIPPGLAGMTSAFGMCPLGSVTIPMTNEMIHVWTVEGASMFGELSDEWRLERLAQSRSILSSSQ